MKKFPWLAFFILVSTLSSANSTLEQLQDSIKIDIRIKNKDSGQVLLYTPDGRKFINLTKGKAFISMKIDRAPVLQSKDLNYK